MRVIMPRAIVYPEAEEALLAAWQTPEIVVMSDPGDYWRLVRGLWHAGEAFCLVEHDVVVRPDTITELWTCPNAWCAFPYHQRPGNPVTGLGCTRFLRHLLRDFDPFAGEPDHRWENVDAALVPRIRDRGWTEHVHEPWLEHLNPKAKP